MRAALTVGLALVAPCLFGASCESLRSLALPGTTLTTAELVPAGNFQPPYGSLIEKSPAFCRVSGVISPTKDSSITFEVWMPASGWNGKFRGVGNGGFAGSIDYRGMGGNVARGYATAGTDTGHDGEAEDASWAYRHPEKIIDFGYRGLHLTTVNAKAVVRAFYDQPARKAYFDACSDGGREALMEAQRFPEDYDGILAGAPAYNWTHLVTGNIGALQMMLANPQGYVSGTKLPAISAAVRKACDAADGVQDGLISDPEHCQVDLSVLRCRGAETRSCLTEPQLATLQRLHKGSAIAPGFVPGGEATPHGWSDWIIGPGPGGASSVAYLENYLRYMVYEDPGLDVLKVKTEDALARADGKTAAALNATDTDLSRFQARGGKLILYHGWDDPAISPYFSTRYYEGVRKRMTPGKTAGFVRLYLAAGMGHCFGGPGASAFGQLGIPSEDSKYGLGDALESWVEDGREPGEIVATKYVGDAIGGKVQMTRPLCAYPSVPVYKGQGKSAEASSFSCESKQP